MESDCNKRKIRFRKMNTKTARNGKRYSNSYFTKSHAMTSWVTRDRDRVNPPCTLCWLSCRGRSTHQWTVCRRLVKVRRRSRRQTEPVASMMLVNSGVIVDDVISDVVDDDAITTFDLGHVLHIQGPKILQMTCDLWPSFCRSRDRMQYNCQLAMWLTPVSTIDQTTTP